MFSILSRSRKMSLNPISLLVTMHLIDGLKKENFWLLRIEINYLRNNNYYVFTSLITFNCNQKSIYLLFKVSKK